MDDVMIFNDLKLKNKKKQKNKSKEANKIKNKTGETPPSTAKWTFLTMIGS